jgi:hypothetical protein
LGEKQSLATAGQIAQIRQRRTNKALAQPRHNDQHARRGFPLCRRVGMRIAADNRNATAERAMTLPRSSRE